MSDGRLPLKVGRTAFGVDAEVYDRARPPYPDALYALLDFGQLIEGRTILDVGAGTGAATLELARRGARRITALEPHPRLAELLVSKSKSSNAPVEVRVETLEEADLPDASFDLVVSATAFHWVDETLGLEIVRRALRPGAAIALWWSVFGDPTRDDPFHAATKRRLGIGFTSPSAGVRPTRD